MFQGFCSGLLCRLQSYSPFFCMFFKALALIGVILAIVLLLLKIIKKNLERLSFINVTNRVFMEHIIRSIIIFIAVVIGLDTMGLELRSLAFISGALFLGIGFGIQKIASNFISGMILLFVKVIKVGDLIELKDGKRGRVTNISMLYTTIESLDMTEALIPNETFLIDKVINWTHTNSQGRIDIDVTIAYGSDVEHAMDLIVRAAKDHPKVSKQKAPVCFLKEMGDNGLELFLIVYINDVTKGRFGIKSAINIAILKAFNEHNIEIPYPVRTLKFDPQEIKKIV